MSHDPVVRRAFFGFLEGPSASPFFNVDGDAAQVEFIFKATKSLIVNRVNIVVVANAKEDITGFFSLPALSNGLTIVHRESVADGGDTIEDFGTDIMPIKRHADFGALAGVDVMSDTEANRSRYSIRWTLARSGLALVMIEDEEFVITVRDDISTLLDAHVQIQGY